MKFVKADGGRSKYFSAESVGDCVCRAIANASGWDYKVVYDGLADLCKKERITKRHRKQSSPRNGVYNKTVKKYIEEVLGWEWHPTMGIGTGCRVHLDDRELPNCPAMIVNVSKHLTCVKDGVLYDTYDCTRDGTRCVYGYWTPPKEPSTKPVKKREKVAKVKEYSVHYVSTGVYQKEYYGGHFQNIEEAKELAERKRSNGLRNVWVVEREVTEWKRVRA